MGRELRRVPPNWDHPMVQRSNGQDGYQPMYDRRFEDAVREWKDDFQKWEQGERPSYCSEESQKLEFWEWEAEPPCREYYRPWKDDEATWYQVWETVSEGTPVSPPFETQDELIDYLVENGDFWDQRRRKDGRSSMPCDPWSREQAEKFVRGPGWACSMVLQNGVLKSGVEAL